MHSNRAVQFVLSALFLLLAISAPATIISTFPDQTADLERERTCDHHARQQFQNDNAPLLLIAVPDLRSPDASLSLSPDTLPTRLLSITPAAPTYAYDTPNCDDVHKLDPHPAWIGMDYIDPLGLLTGGEVFAGLALLYLVTDTLWAPDQETTPEYIANYESRSFQNKVFVASTLVMAPVAGVAGGGTKAFLAAKGIAGARQWVAVTVAEGATFGAGVNTIEQSFDQRPGIDVPEVGKSAAVGAATFLVFKGTFVLAKRSGQWVIEQFIPGPRIKGLVPQRGPGAQLLAEYRRFKAQGRPPNEAEYLTQLYDNGNRMGHHYPITRSTARELGIPESLRDCPLNVLKPQGMNLGRFHELHYQVDPNFSGCSLGKGMQSWRGADIGIEKLEGLPRIWYATPGPLKAVGGTAAAGGGGFALWWWMTDEDE